MKHYGQMNWIISRISALENTTDIKLIRRILMSFSNDPKKRKHSEKTNYATLNVYGSRCSFSYIKKGKYGSSKQGAGLDTKLIEDRYPGENVVEWLDPRLGVSTHLVYKYAETFSL